MLAATNIPYNLDNAIRRRFDKRILIPLPDEKVMLVAGRSGSPHE